MKRQSELYSDIQKIYGNGIFVTYLNDLVIVHPPRAGLDKKSCQYLIDMNPKNIIYISCDPNTLMRDLKILGNIYSIKEITPYNLFPKTYHCESIVVLERK